MPSSATFDSRLLLVGGLGLLKGGDQFLVGNQAISIRVNCFEYLLCILIGDTLLMAPWVKFVVREFAALDQAVGKFARPS